MAIRRIKNKVLLEKLDCCAPPHITTVDIKIVLDSLDIQRGKLYKATRVCRASFKVSAIRF